MVPLAPIFSFFFFNDTATTEIYTLSLHDALPIFSTAGMMTIASPVVAELAVTLLALSHVIPPSVLTSTSKRSEEHTSELQSPSDIVCRLLLTNKIGDVT